MKTLEDKAAAFLIVAYGLACLALGIGCGYYAVHGDHWALALAVFSVGVITQTNPYLMSAGRRK